MKQVYFNHLKDSVYLSYKKWIQPFFIFDQFDFAFTASRESDFVRFQIWQNIFRSYLNLVLETIQEKRLLNPMMLNQMFLISQDDCKNYIPSALFYYLSLKKLESQLPNIYKTYIAEIKDRFQKKLAHDPALAIFYFYHDVINYVIKISQLKITAEQLSKALKYYQTLVPEKLYQKVIYQIKIFSWISPLFDNKFNFPKPIPDYYFLNFLKKINYEFQSLWDHQKNIGIWIGFLRTFHDGLKKCMIYVKQYPLTTLSIITTATATSGWKLFYNYRDIDKIVMTASSIWLTSTIKNEFSTNSLVFLNLPFLLLSTPLIHALPIKRIKSDESGQNYNKDIFKAIDQGIDEFQEYLMNNVHNDDTYCEPNDEGDEVFIYAIKQKKPDILALILEKQACHVKRFEEVGLLQTHPLCLMIEYLKNSPEVYPPALQFVGQGIGSLRCNNGQETVLTYVIQEHALEIFKKIIYETGESLLSLTNIENLTPLEMTINHNQDEMFLQMVNSYIKYKKRIPSNAYNLVIKNNFLGFQGLIKLFNADSSYENKLTFLNSVIDSDYMEHILKEGTVNIKDLNDIKALLFAANRGRWGNVGLMMLKSQNSKDGDKLNINVNVIVDNKSILFYMLRDSKFEINNINFIKRLKELDFDFKNRICQDLNQYISYNPTGAIVALENYKKHSILSRVKDCALSEDILGLSQAFSILLKEFNHDPWLCNIRDQKQRHLLFYIASKGSIDDYNHFLDACSNIDPVKIRDQGCSTLDVAQIDNPNLFTELIINVTRTVFQKRLRIADSFTAICQIDQKSVISRTICQSDYDNFKRMIERFPNLANWVFVGYDNVYQLIKDCLNNTIENQDVRKKEFSKQIIENSFMKSLPSSASFSNLPDNRTPKQICIAFKQILELHKNTECDNICKKYPNKNPNFLVVFLRSLTSTDMMIGIAALSAIVGFYSMNKRNANFLQEINSYSHTSQNRNQSNLEDNSIGNRSSGDIKDSHFLGTRYHSSGTPKQDDRFLSFERPGCTMKSLAIVGLGVGVSALIGFGLFRNPTQPSDSCIIERDIWLKEMEQRCANLK